MQVAENWIGFYVNWKLVLADRDNKLPLEYPPEYPSWILEYREGIMELMGTAVPIN
jgi:hypothetical protein